MREVLDEAIQRLYWACRRKTNFPGDVPDESTGVVTTDVILRGLRLSGPGLDGARQPPDQSERNHDHDGPHPQTTTSPVEPDPLHSNNATSASTSTSTSTPRSSFASPSTYGRRLLASPSLQPPSPSELNFSMNLEMLPQTVAVSPQAPARRPVPTMVGFGPRTEIPAQASHGGDPYLDGDAFLDASWCTVPMESSSPPDLLSGALHWDSVATRRPHSMDQSSQPGPLCDSYLAPWPGSLAAAYQSVPAV
ncbi:hypothetical protein LTS07_011364 [Exophiala sideris]|uniref:Transcription factor domain-containing protein n=1 Tax=Exophiala sideris TaxID=1016849 RepID=A0ABR0IUB9_9EURO|nr:hypothetical protein LTS07_011364 [Exophiala sideris]KAK5023102.1 hypothetical protein LTR13_011333 [Exophiala sideris]KAK5048417.1 hypothetical protein LTR69_011379 [Exophiala sideris]